MKLFFFDFELVIFVTIYDFFENINAQMLKDWKGWKSGNRGVSLLLISPRCEEMNNDGNVDVSWYKIIYSTIDIIVVESTSFK